MLSDKQTAESKGLAYFSTAFLISFIFGIIGFTLSILMVGIAFVSVSTPPPTSGPPPAPPSRFTMMLPTLAVSAVGVILYVYYLWHGFDMLDKVVPDISLGKTGSILSLFSVFIYPLLVPILNINYSSPNILGEILGYIGALSILAIIAFIGIIMVIIGIYRIGKYYESTIIKVGAILLIFLGFIGAIILFIGFKDLEKNPRKSKTVLLPPPPSW